MSGGTALAQQNGAVISPIEHALVGNNLSELSGPQRLEYLNAVCESLKLNPLTKPFQYISLNGKLTLYATRDCTDQLRRIHRISIEIVGRVVDQEILYITARATAPDGRTDESIGAVSIAGLKGEGRANAYMKAETKAKRRVALSICGLGMLDESETDSVPGAVRVNPTTGEVIERPTPALPVTTARVAEATEQQPSYAGAVMDSAKPTTLGGLRTGVMAFLTGIGQTPEQAKAPREYLAAVLGREIASLKDLTIEEWGQLWETLATARNQQVEMLKAWGVFAKAQGHKASDRDIRLQCIGDILGRTVESTGFLTPEEMEVAQIRFIAGAEGGSDQVQQALIPEVMEEENPFADTPEHPRSGLAH